MSCLNLDDNFWYPVFVDGDGNLKHHFNSALYPANGTIDTDDNVDVPDFKVNSVRISFKLVFNTKTSSKQNSSDLFVC